MVQSTCGTLTSKCIPMELDDLKKAWNAQQPSSPEEERERIRQIIHRSQSGIVKMIRWEAAIGIVSMAILLIAVLFQDGMTTYFIKLAAPLVLYAIPVYYRLHRSSQFLQTLDLSGDVRTTLTQFLGYYTRTLRFYRWGGYVAILASLALIFTEEIIQNLNWYIKGLVIALMAVAMLLIGPFVKRFYGPKARVIREYLEEKE